LFYEIFFLSEKKLKKQNKTIENAPTLYILI